jgi:L-aspartate oxidase
MDRAQDDVDLEDVDFLVIGSGIAGLTYALRTSQHGSTVILTKKNRAESSSNYAQGGIAGVMGEDDDVSLHIQDTLIAGAGLCHEDAVRVLVTEGPERIRDLMALGAHFTMETGEDGRSRLSLGREGGHSRNRIIHAVDRTGWECERTLLTAAKDAPNLRVHDHYFVVDLLVDPSRERRCVGALALDPIQGKLHFFRAKAVLLATGGCGHVYQHTTNPPIATGDGVAMAWRLGATVANMEFIQFHPTALYHPDGRSFLISEAVRGEGGILRTRSGETFMADYDPRAELAPRDIVARAIHAERLKREEPCVFLDVTHLDADFLRHRFPTIYDRCLELGIDITKQPIPVVPAAHYMCGGVETDLDGRTSVAGLYAAGEVACTGVHGANRLASNSLLEAMVYGRRAADAAVSWATREASSDLTPICVESAVDHPHPHRVAEIRAELQQTMNDNVGIVRNTHDLQAALARVLLLRASVERLLSELHPHADLYELRNLTTVAELIVQSAISRHESRGLHYTTDFPATDDVHWRHDTVLKNDSLD